MSRNTAGFTLLEVMVVVGIIGILSSVLFINFSESGEQSRDAQRQADLRQLQSAIELYKNRHGRYPKGCNGTGWSGEPGNVHACTTAGEQYIEDLAPEFIPALPVDPNPASNESGYAYRVNAEGTVYKVMNKGAVESEEVVTYGHPFQICDVPGVCDAVWQNSNNKPNYCGAGHPIFKKSYAVWGGFPYEPEANISEKAENEQEKVICSIP